MTALRITIAADRFPELSETFIAAEAQMLAGLGHAVRIEAGRRADDPDPQAGRGLEVRYLEDDRLGRRVRALIWLALRYPRAVARDLLDRRRLCREERVRPLRQLAPAARRIHAHGSAHIHAHFGTEPALDAMRLGGLLGLPYSFATHGYDIFLTPANLAAKHERAAFAVSACQYSVDHLRAELGSETTARLHRLVVGVDVERFRRRAPHSSPGTVLAIGRLVEKKGFTHLVEAAAKLRESGALERVLIVGEGPLRRELEALIARTGAPVELLGARPHTAIRDLLEEAALLVMPCVVAANGDRDTMPVVVKEALAMEVPVVATDEVGLPEVVQPDWGRLAPPGNPDALADAIRDLLELPAERRAEMGRAGREFVLEHCDLGRETEKLVGLIRRYGGEG
jgi:colanic acid/amylovoran biosynthesis glycosyltransferase